MLTKTTDGKKLRADLSNYAWSPPTPEDDKLLREALERIANSGNEKAPASIQTPFSLILTWSIRSKIGS